MNTELRKARIDEFERNIDSLSLNHANMDKLSKLVKIEIESEMQSTSKDMYLSNLTKTYAYFVESNRYYRVRKEKDKRDIFNDFVSNLKSDLILPLFD
jgi:hypothetical protein